ncbi:MAG: cell envelope integrity protein CreD [Saprospiraceae bacterium]|nr:cell envelope integrity protein CreD [Saprospiraceae bacterium]
MENQTGSTGSRIGHWMRTSLLVKLLSIGFIVLLLLIPKAMIQSLIFERQNRQAEVIHEISESWGGKQFLTGPVLSIPYTEWIAHSDGKKSSALKVAHFLPQELNIKGEARHELRKRSLFDAVLYHAGLELTGKFEAPAFRELNITPDQIHWDEARVSVGISSMPGIKNIIELNWNGAKRRMEPGTAYPALLSSGVSAMAAISEGQEGYEFSIPLELNGTELLYFEPVGRVTTVDLRSTWPSPSFSGKMLPEKREIGKDGFSAAWKVLDLNRNYPQQWKNEAFSFEDANFGVKLIQPVDEYLKNERAVKYAIMLIGLTFLIYFFFEVLRRFHIHPFQYLLVGLVLTVFYLLLLSLSEQVGFNAAYGIASVATIGLISFYSAAVLQVRRLTVQLTLLLCAMYGFIFVVLQLEDYALLAGSIGIFVALAAVMYYSRKVDWYNLGSGKGD